MSDILFKCQNCQKNLSVDVSGAGNNYNCPDCQNTVTAPSPAYSFQCINCNESYVSSEEYRGQEFLCPNCSLPVTAPRTGGNAWISCPSCKSNIEIEGTAQDWSGQTVECPDCHKIITMPEVSQPAKIKLRTNNSLTPLPPADNNEHMLFATCPKCNRNDVIAVCTNCKKQNHFTGSGTYSECKCGTPIASSFICPYCKTNISNQDFAPDAVKQKKVNANRKYVPILGFITFGTMAAIGIFWYLAETAVPNNSSSPSSLLSALFGNEPVSCAKDMISKNLTCPSTAQWVEAKVVDENPPSYIVYVSVDSQNALGARIRSGFLCSLTMKGGGKYEYNPLVGLLEVDANMPSAEMIQAFKAMQTMKQE